MTGQHEVAAAMCRLDAAARLNSIGRQLTNAGYYGTKFQLEDVCGDLSHDGNVRAVVTRNRFGCLVLNAADAMFIDIDRAELNGANVCNVERQTLRDIRTVLAQTTTDFVYIGPRPAFERCASRGRSIPARTSRVG